MCRPKQNVSYRVVAAPVSLYACTHLRRSRAPPLSVMTPPAERLFLAFIAGLCA